jgi:hypothetical protein
MPKFARLLISSMQLLICVGVFLGLPGVGHAQLVQPGDPFEYYVRVLQISDEIPSKSSWLLRPVVYNPLEVNRSKYSYAGNAKRYLWEPFLDQGRNLRLSTLDPVWFTSYNTNLPRGTNDGALWQGRGVNSTFSAGLEGNVGFIHFRFRPVIGYSQNLFVDVSDYAIGPFMGGVMRADRNPYSYPFYNFDHVLRYGEDPLSWFDLGDSYVQLRYQGFFAGVSNTRKWVGPALYNPLMVSYNAAGFKHVELGTYNPIRTILGSFEFNYFLGFINKSDFYDQRTDNRLNTYVSVAGVYSPSFIKGLSLGVNRLFIEDYPDNQTMLVDQAIKVINPFFKETLIEIDPTLSAQPDNQMFSLFFRWAFPKNGFELYGEFGRNDNNVDARDFRMQPDHDSAWLFGFVKSIDLGRRRLLALSYEVSDFEGSRNSFARGRGGIARPDNVGISGRWFAHHTRNDFTHDGQLLGSAVGPGGSSYTLRFDLFNPGGMYGLRFSHLTYGNGWLNYPETLGIIMAANEPGVKRKELRNSELLVSVDMTKTVYGSWEVSGLVERSFIQNHWFIKDNDVRNTRLQLVLRKRIGGGLR